jgi:trans-aconitate methyltransferase
MKLTKDEIMYLGANACQYSQKRKKEEKQTDFDWASNKIALIVKVLKQLPKLERVADIGCRTGKEAAYYKEQLGIKEMHGFEISDYMKLSNLTHSLV